MHNTPSNKGNVKSKTAAFAALLFLVSICSTTMAYAQQYVEKAATSPNAVPMATGMRSNGKIYVVVAVLVVIICGLFFYLISLDRKLKRLEKK